MPGIILILGAGETASGTAVRLRRSGFRIVLTEIAMPLAVRRLVAFSEAVHDGVASVEGVEAVRVAGSGDCARIQAEGRIPLLVAPGGRAPAGIECDALVDGRILKGGHGLTREAAPVVIGLGPGFHPGVDCRFAVETNRGHALGALLETEPERDTGRPGMVGGYADERVLRAPVSGFVASGRRIGDRVAAGDEVARVGSATVRAPIAGILRGLIRPGTEVRPGLKIGDIDPRLSVDIRAVSDKALAVAGGVLEGLLRTGVKP